MKEIYGAIDMGTHTARLLIARVEGSPSRLVPLERRRAYTRLGENFDPSGERVIETAAMDRALDELAGFNRRLEAAGAGQVHAVATGVVREARNRDLFLARIHDRTGIRVRSITGEEEAALTARGVLHALAEPPGATLIFDLGGGSTEFIYISGGDAPVVVSIPLGAVLLTEGFLTADPPGENEIDRLFDHIDTSLDTTLLKGIRGQGIHDMVATGGTATSLAAMLHDIPVARISPERMNGLRIERLEIEALFKQVRRTPCDERARLTGLDKGRAKVMAAGAAAVIRIMDYFNRRDLAVCLSDLLEGILIEVIEGEKDG
ncbi:MAG: hypothetical protein JRK53_19430 [Deltaproteobacteria bacterium]|nr:hypothetical protein [Deltaproteobacteria bacterium]